MVVGVRPRFTNAQIREIFTDRLKRIDIAIISRLQYIGEAFVKNARQKADFTDRTGNLRNSIGYVILKNGVQLYENFRRSASVEVTVTAGQNRGGKRRTKGSTDGVQIGKDFAEETSKKFTNGYVLIVVAGMDYAAAVESKGYDVITASSITAKRDLQNAITALKQKITKMR
ncbi:hypothetical protein AB6805_30620 [Chitinophaga sp. RCC_12]|uniref:hypothetical protein n=1 Tax=Chitinophaga sp. RCC_12 TaxID=3239226 RepID=UPI003524FC5B